MVVVERSPPCGEHDPLAGKPASFGFGTTPDPDYKKVKSDFNIADRASGRVTLIGGSDKKKLAINDENQYEYVVWYKIEALCQRSDEGDAWVTTTDPRVKNSGN